MKVKREGDLTIPHHLVNLLQRCTNSCKDRTKATHEDLAPLHHNKIPESQKGLCFLQCMMEKLGIIVKNRFVKNAVVTTFGAIVKNEPEKKNYLRQVSEICSAEQHTWQIEQCGDLARNILQCFSRYKGDMNFSVPLSQIKF